MEGTYGAARRNRWGEKDANRRSTTIQTLIEVVPKTRAIDADVGGRGSRGWFSRGIIELE